MEFTIKPTAKFETSLEALTKAHYRKDKLSSKQLFSMVKKCLKSCCADYKIQGSKPEPFPKGVTEENLRFRKWYFNLSNLKDAASTGRLIYMINTKNKEIHPIWIYTHKQFKRRPLEKELKKSILDILSND